MKITMIFCLLGACVSLELLSKNVKGSWSSTGSNAFENAKPTYHRHAYKSVYVGKTSGGGLCAGGKSSHLEAKVTLKDNSDAATKARGNYAGIAMRADSKTNSRGYQCKLSTEHGDNGIMLTRNGKSVSGCPRIDQSNGVYNRYTSGYRKDVKGPYDFKNLCQIQERVKSNSLFIKEKLYTVRMEVEQDIDLNTATVSCSVDGITRVWFTDPCPLKGGEFALDSKYQSTFKLTDFTGTSCDAVPTKAVAAPSLADGLKISGMGKTKSYWVSKDLAATSSVVHRYVGGCNNAGGLNREGGGRSNSALNVGALDSGKCVKDGFMEAQVSFRGDFLGDASGYKKVSDDGKFHHNQRPGVAGIAMRVDSTGTGSAGRGGDYDTFGYMCQMSSVHGKIAVYRGNNGQHHNYNYIGGGYLTGRYKCKNCTCKSPTGCKQFQLHSNGGLFENAKHSLRLEVTTDSAGHNHVKCSLNGTYVADVVDKRSGRHNWFPTSSRSKGPGPKTNQCGKFGLVSQDEDIVEFAITDYTGYVKPTPKPPTTGLQCSTACKWDGKKIEVTHDRALFAKNFKLYGKHGYKCHHDGKTCGCKCTGKSWPSSA